MDAFILLKNDHKKVAALFEQTEYRNCHAVIMRSSSYRRPRQIVF
jgi:hypothetical protein